MDELTPERKRELIDSVAAWVVKRGMEVPAVLFLEMHKPLTFLAGQSALVAMPFLVPIFGLQRTKDLAAFLDKSENLELLIRRIEELVEQRDKGQGTMDNNNALSQEVEEG